MWKKLLGRITFRFAKLRVSCIVTSYLGSKSEKLKRSILWLNPMTNLVLEITSWKVKFGVSLFMNINPSLSRLSCFVRCSGQPFAVDRLYRYCSHTRLSIASRDGSVIALMNGLSAKNQFPVDLEASEPRKAAFYDYRHVVLVRAIFADLPQVTSPQRVHVR